MSTFCALQVNMKDILPCLQNHAQNVFSAGESEGGFASSIEEYIVVNVFFFLEDLLPTF